MFKIHKLFISLALLSVVFGATVIDSREHIKSVDELNSNRIDDEECSSLTPELIKEIKGHQPIVDQIASAVVNGQYSGDTWNAYVY